MSNKSETIHDFSSGPMQNRFKLDQMTVYGFPLNANNFNLMTMLDGFFFFFLNHYLAFGVFGRQNVACLKPGDMRAGGATFRSRTEAPGSGSPMEIR